MREIDHDVFRKIRECSSTSEILDWGEKEALEVWSGERVDFKINRLVDIYTLFYRLKYF